MVRNFQQLLADDEISALDIVDVAENPERAETYDLQSVPSFLLDGQLFNGLRTVGELKAILHAEEHDRLRQQLEDELNSGQLEPVQQRIETDAESREVILRILADPDTPLQLRIGLSAIFEALAGSQLLRKMSPAFMRLSISAMPRIAIDACYYLYLVGTPECIGQLQKLSLSASSEVAEQAAELLGDWHQEHEGVA